jgi:hypothetical protein
MPMPKGVTAWASLATLCLGVILLVVGYHRSLALVCCCGISFCYVVHNIWHVRWVGLMGWPFILGTIIFFALGK